MLLIRPSFEILDFHCSSALIEIAGRTCYKSECKGDPDGFVKMIRRRHHESVLEHSMATVRFVVDRGVTHELVRHRLCAFSQESTRYCNYGKAGHVTFVIPPWVEVEPGEYETKFVDGSVWIPRINGHACPETSVWLAAMASAELRYLDLIERRWSPQQARSVLPNSLKTEIVTTANAREWQHIFSLRTASAAHPQMREVMIPLCREFAVRSPAIFGTPEHLG